MLLCICAKLGFELIWKCVVIISNRERHKHVEKISHCWLRLKCCSWPQSQGLPIPLQIMICSVKLMMDASSHHNNNSKYQKLMKWSDVSETTLWARVPTITQTYMSAYSLSPLLYVILFNIGVYDSGFSTLYVVLHMLENIQSLSSIPLIMPNDFHSICNLILSWHDATQFGSRCNYNWHNRSLL